MDEPEARAASGAIKLQRPAPGYRVQSLPCGTAPPALYNCPREGSNRGRCVLSAESLNFKPPRELRASGADFLFAAATFRSPNDLETHDKNVLNKEQAGYSLGGYYTSFTNRIRGDWYSESVRAAAPQAAPVIFELRETSWQQRFQTSKS
jgi:hypothetical protein